MNELTKIDLKKVINICGPMEKAIVLLMFSSGLCPYEIRRLKVIDFTDSISEYLRQDKEDRAEIMGTWHINSNKSGLEHYTFNSPESNSAIIDYLKWRNQNNGPIHPDELLFINEEGNAISVNEFHDILKNLNNKAKLKERTLTAHKIRKSFVKTINSKLGPNLNDFINYILGHAMDPKVSRNYSSSPHTLKIYYDRVVKSLSINDDETSSDENIDFGILWGI